MTHDRLCRPMKTHHHHEETQDFNIYDDERKKSSPVAVGPTHTHTRSHTHAHPPSLPPTASTPTPEAVTAQQLSSQSKGNICCGLDSTLHVTGCQHSPPPPSPSLTPAGSLDDFTLMAAVQSHMVLVGTG